MELHISPAVSTLDDRHPRVQVPHSRYWPQCRPPTLQCRQDHIPTLKRGYVASTRQVSRIPQLSADTTASWMVCFPRRESLWG
ncbi:Uu.00g084540.m01.CDS01 [Anthostomella pinea]|uniref:Uu.00g084540.m01.CDS01 n=1 Tax=Anthostomella pinea TaxID=933095 RepID=A0AAI8VGD9_9PEZI|nr:Uu.00g084540.m01.CDS01 [Anthostomella pinea]